MANRIAHRPLFPRVLLPALATVFAILACSEPSQQGPTPAPLAHPLASITFMEGNDCTQSIVAQLLPTWGQVVEPGSAPGFANDEARSVLLDGALPDTLIRVFDSRDGDMSDDWAEILVTALASGRCVGTFEDDFSDDAVTVVYHAVNGLDGKVSRVEILSAPYSTAETPTPPSATRPIHATETTGPSPTDEVVPSRTLAPTHTRPPTPTTQPSGLPGLAPADVTVNLEDRGHTCSSAEATYDGGFVWSCTRETIDMLLYVDIYSRSLVTVDMLDASVIFFGSPDDELASQFLGFLATMPYDGSQPLDAREWVETTLPTIRTAGDVRETTICGVAFQLFGIPTARSLQMGDLGE